MIIRVESALFRGLFCLDKGYATTNDISANDEIDRPKGFSRGSSSVHRCSILQSSEPSCHALADTFCFQINDNVNTFAEEKEWIKKINKLLPNYVQVLSRFSLTHEEASEIV